MSHIFKILFKLMVIAGPLLAFHCLGLGLVNNEATALDEFSQDLIDHKVHLHDKWNKNLPLLTPYTINEIVIEENCLLSDFWSSLYSEEREKINDNVQRLHLTIWQLSYDDIHIIHNFKNLEYLYIKHYLKSLEVLELAGKMRIKNYRCLINANEQWIICEKFKDLYS